MQPLASSAQTIIASVTVVFKSSAEVIELCELAVSTRDIGTVRLTEACVDLRDSSDVRSSWLVNIGSFEAAR